jgi:hypothetical protein
MAIPCGRSLLLLLVEFHIIPASAYNADLILHLNRQVSPDTPRDAEPSMRCCPAVGAALLAQSARCIKKPEAPPEQQPLRPKLHNKYTETSSHSLTSINNSLEINVGKVVQNLRVQSNPHLSCSAPGDHLAQWLPTTMTMSCPNQPKGTSCPSRSRAWLSTRIWVSLVSTRSPITLNK